MADGHATSAPNLAPLDAVDLEVFNHRFAAIAEEMGTTLMRAAFSPNIKERRDFSCAVFTAEGQMLAQAAHIPVHLGSAPLSVQAVADVVPLFRGEVGIVNDPFAGGTHLPDITLVEPVYGAGPAPLFWVANRAHHADVGGSSPGSMPMVSHIDDEGFRIPPSKLTPELESQFLAAVRSPRERRGDLAAQKAANRIGRLRLEALLADLGQPKVLLAAQQLMDWSERWMAQILRGLPEGRFEAEDTLEGDGLSHGPIRVAVTVDLRGESAVIDFSGCGPQVPGPVNAVRAIAVSAVAYVFRCLAGPMLPSNEGFMRRLRVVTRPGTVADALPPAAVGAGNVETSQRLVDVLFAAISSAAPHYIPAASCGSMNNLLFGGIAPSGEGFTYYETIAGGSGGAPTGPGASAVQTHMTNTLNTPIEALERALPVRVRAYRIRRGSGGAGSFNGGDGVIRALEFLAPAEVTLIGERRQIGAPGACGGAAGAPGADWLYRTGQAPRRLSSKGQFHVQPMDVIEIHTPGGGGYGPPSRSHGDTRGDTDT